MYSIYIILLVIVLTAFKPTRPVMRVLLPWAIFACSYDWMRLLPNYTINTIDIADLYNAEKHLFGISTSLGVVLTPGEWFNIHHCAVADFMAGLFYLCWVPVPLAFTLYLFLRGDRHSATRFAWAFLFVNILGFIGYYIHPAAPPWYVMQYGLEPITGTPGNVAGLGRFDELMGLPIFHNIYGKNANVFAAVPSLHAAYLLITTVYAIIAHHHELQQNGNSIVPVWLIGLFAFICVGIWWTAVYSGHHYVIDVLLGIATAIVGITLYETVRCILSIEFFSPKKDDHLAFSHEK